MVTAGLLVLHGIVKESNYLFSKRKSMIMFKHFFDHFFEHLLIHAAPFIPFHNNEEAATNFFLKSKGNLLIKSVAFILICCFLGILAA